MLHRVVANLAGGGVVNRRFFVEEDIIATVATLRRHRYDTCLFSEETLPEISGEANRPWPRERGTSKNCASRRRQRKSRGRRLPARPDRVKRKRPRKERRRPPPSPSDRR